MSIKNKQQLDHLPVLWANQEKRKKKIQLCWSKRHVDPPVDQHLALSARWPVQPLSLSTWVELCYVRLHHVKVFIQLPSRKTKHTHLITSTSVVKLACLQWFDQIVIVWRLYQNTVIHVCKVQQPGRVILGFRYSISWQNPCGKRQVNKCN